MPLDGLEVALNDLIIALRTAAEACDTAADSAAVVSHAGLFAADDPNPPLAGQRPE